MLINQNTSCFQ